MAGNTYSLPQKQHDKDDLSFIERVIRVPGTTGDDARRRRLLNMVLLAILILSVVLVVLSLLQLSSPALSQSDIDNVQLGVISSTIMTGVVLFLYAINRFYSGYLAGILLVLLLTVAISVSDSPEQLTQGRSTFFFALPIMIASVVLRPRMTFVAATIVVIPLVLLTENGLLELNFAAVTGFYIVAMLAWLAASSLETALNELRVINAELDQRVEQRTIELKDALSSVQRESRKNEAILTSIADGVVVFNAQGQATVANNAMNKLLELPDTKIVGRNISNLTQQQLQLDVLEQQVSNRKIEIGDRTLSVSVAPVQLESQVSKELVAVFRDFTREEQLNRMKDAFVSMASHELRTPLNAIIGYSDMLKEKVYGEINEDQERLAGRIMANTKRMLSLVNNMLDQAQIAVGKLSLNIQPFQLAEMVYEVDSVMSVLAESKSLAFQIHLSDDMPRVLLGDKERLVQIIINLTGNAVKFTDEGSVHVNISRTSDDLWRIVVKDTGRGIPKHMQDSIFQPFEQVEDAHTRRVGGSGLGLSIVRLLTELMGGQIHLESSVGIGSTFTIELPLKTSLEGSTHE